MCILLIDATAKNRCGLNLPEYDLNGRQPFLKEVGRVYETKLTAMSCALTVCVVDISETDMLNARAATEMSQNIDEFLRQNHPGYIPLGRNKKAWYQLQNHINIVCRFQRLPRSQS